MIKTYKITVCGKVQDVYYRSSAKNKAINMGLTGIIWNEENGDVTARIQGPLNKIFSFIEWCKKGPRQAKVEKVMEEEVDQLEVYTSFDVLE